MEPAYTTHDVIILVVCLTVVQIGITMAFIKYFSAALRDRESTIADLKQTMGFMRELLDENYKG